MKLKKLSKYFYRHPKDLFKSTFIVSVVLHGAILIQIPFLSFTRLPAQKAKMTIINISLEKIKVHSKTNIVKKKEEQNKIVGEGLAPSRKIDDAIPYLKKEENKIVGEGLVSSRKTEEKIEQEKFTPPPPSVSKDTIIKARETYEDRILKRINEMKYYPMRARRMDQEAMVRVEFVLKRNGILKGDIVIAKGCRYEALNNAAIETIVRANPYPPFPNEIKKREMTFVVDVDFRLEVW